MKNKIVKYNNKMNDIALRNFTEKELNIFFTLLFKLKNKDVNTVSINFKELKKISNGESHNKRFVEAITNLNDKLLSLTQKVEIEKGVFLQFNLFNTFKIDLNRKILEARINDDFKFMLNDLLDNFTQFELEQLVTLKSSFSKNMFRLLKQISQNKWRIIKIDDFKRILCIPDSYKMGNIDQQVLKTILRELSPLFPNLKVEKIKKGVRVTHLKFTWSNSCELIEKETSKKVEITKELNEAIEFAKKNRFITKYLTPTNIEALLKDYTQERLVKGLFFAKNQIQREFTSLNYLKKVIATGIEASEKVFKIIDSEENNEVIQEEVVESSNSALENSKSEVAKWCMKNKKYVILGKIEDIKTFEDLARFIEENNIEI